ncbi:MAG: hypothetical protein CW338_05245 [Clostridiales bacterium]|nr:hypothetical protein [Clostridiales bacterium]
MICITGDTHGEVSRFSAIGKACSLTPKDMLIVAGDFGCIFDPDGLDEMKLERLAALPFTILFLDGNHECFPRLYGFPMEEWHGGKVHRVRPNILHLMRGQIFDLEGTSVFTMGGGYSIDVMYRIPGRSWWPEEMPDDDEYAEAWENLKKHSNEVDVIISHAAPEETMKLFVQTGVFHDRFSQEMRLNNFLEDVRQTVKHKRYFFGHLHMDRTLFRDQTALFYDVYDLQIGERIMQQE